MERGLAEARKMAGIGQNRLRVGTLYSLTLKPSPVDHGDEAAPPGT